LSIVSINQNSEPERWLFRLDFCDQAWGFQSASSCISSSYRPRKFFRFPLPGELAPPILPGSTSLRRHDIEAVRSGTRPRIANCRNWARCLRSASHNRLTKLAAADSFRGSGRLARSRLIPALRPAAGTLIWGVLAAAETVAILGDEK
jgi:hypothetical protein